MKSIYCPISHHRLFDVSPAITVRPCPENNSPSALPSIAIKCPRCKKIIHFIIRI